MEFNSQENPVRLAVLGCVIKPAPDGQFLVFTGKRFVQNPAYDPLYDQAWEGMGETLEPGESLIHALLRGIREEYGVDLSTSGGYSILGSDCEVVEEFVSATCEKDEYINVSPFLVTLSMKAPQSWLGVGFIVRLDNPDWEPDFSKGDGEAGNGKWWTPGELLSAITDSPNDFMGLHIALLGATVRAIIFGSCSQVWFEGTE